MLKYKQDTVAIDQLVGRQLRLLRITHGYSQGALADKLGITYQQIQKYESGHNRISAGRIWQLAEIFNVDPNTLFDTLMQTGTSSEGGAHIDPLYVKTSEEMRLLSAFKDIDDRDQRSLVVKMAQAFSCQIPA